MMQFLINLFIPNNKEVTRLEVREKYINLSSIFGLVSNILLFLMKVSIGTFVGSLAIISDGFNNLSDCLTSVIALVGNKLASKPADKEHPYGHGRIEYILSFIFAIFILVFGLELLKESFFEILNPSKIKFSIWALLILLFSILVKLWLSHLNKVLGKIIDSDLLIAISYDARNDVYTSLIALIALVFSSYVEFSLDGLMGILVSFLILKSGYDIIKNTINLLIGISPDKKLVDRVTSLINSKDKIIGFHDLLIHDYGPGRKFGSCHIEINSRSNFLDAHQVIDDLEKEIRIATGLDFTIHMDPIEIDDENNTHYYKRVKEIVKEIDEEIHINDFRVTSEHNKIILSFDLGLPLDLNIEEESLLRDIKNKLDKDIEVKISFNKNLIEI